MSKQNSTSSHVRAKPGTRKQCKAAGCSKSIPDRFLMCRAHWSLVPEDLQNAVYRTYRELKENWCGETLKAYTAAVTAAITAVADAQASVR